MDEVVQASVIENIADGSVECQIVVTGDGFAVVGQGTVTNEIVPACPADELSA
jgi:hypothetical protein